MNFKPKLLENTQNGASKFWSVDVQGTDAHVRYGRIGTKGRESVKAFATPEAAAAYAEKKINEKIKGGYEVQDAFVASSGQAPSLGAAAAAPTPGGVLAARLGNMTTTSGAIKVNLKEHYSRVAKALPDVKKGFKALVAEVENYEPKGVGTPLAFLHKLDPKLLPKLVAKEKELDAFFAGPAKPLLAKSLSGALTEAELEPVHSTLHGLKKWIQTEVELPSLMMSSTRVIGLASTPVNDAIRVLPDLKSLAAPKLTAKAFAKLDASERASVLRNAEARGYDKEELGDDEAQVKALIGDAGLREIFSFATDLAEQDADAADSDVDVEIGDPSISELMVIKSGSEILGYQVETHINWQPADVDYVGVHMIMPDGTLFGEDYR